MTPDLEREGVIVRRGWAADVRFAQGAASFKVDGLPVVMQLAGQHIFLRSGEEVVVAGFMKNGFLSAVAYENISNGTKISPGPTFLFLGLGAVFMLAPIFVFSVTFGALRGNELYVGVPLALGMSAIFFAVGFALFRQIQRVRRAQRVFEESKEQMLENALQ